jgi:hypothetical protein
MDMHDDWERARVRLIEALTLAGVAVAANQIKTDDWGCPHTPKSLPKNKMAVYTFFYGDKCLKVGKAGAKSNARYSSQHYFPENSKSNLADSILADKGFLKNLSEPVNKDTIGDWLKRKTRRINMLLDETLGPFVLNFAEAFLQVCFKPKYEGFKSQTEVLNWSPGTPNKNTRMHNRDGNPGGYITYENHANPHVTIHINDGNCRFIRKNGGGDGGDGRYTEHGNLKDAHDYANRTGLPVINECAFCKKRYGVDCFSDIGLI